MPAAWGELEPQGANAAGGMQTWTGTVTLPAPRGTQPFRVTIREEETWNASGPRSELADIQIRLVYADSVIL